MEKKYSYEMDCEYKGVKENGTRIMVEEIIDTEVQAKKPTFDNPNSPNIENQVIRELRKSPAGRRVVKTFC